MSMRPTPCSPASTESRSTSSTGPTRSPSRPTGIPEANSITISIGSSGVSSIGFVHAYASAGGSAHGSSIAPHSIARPHRFSSIEYGELPPSRSGMSCRRQYSIASSREI